MPVLSDLLIHSLIAGAVGFFWGLSEIVGEFKNETGRALRTAGAWLLLLLNFAAASLVFLFIASIIPGANTWITAVLVGFAWPTVIRNTSIKLVQPLQSKKTTEAAALRFEQAYAAIQNLAYELINNPLTRERTRLVMAAQRYDLAALEQMARMAVIATPRAAQGGKTAEEFGQRLWYYAKVLRKRATLISLAVAPDFYALSENYGEPDKDYLLQYDAGRLTFEAKTLYETLLAEGPLDTVSLRKLAKMTSKASDSPFNRALETLQADFKILPVGVAEAGAWKYAFIYECVHRHYPDLAARARPIRQADARRTLAELYLRSVGAARAKDLALLFGWPAREIAAALDALARDGIAQPGVTVAEQPGEWAALAELG
jgi:hypothetical protein